MMAATNEEDPFLQVQRDVITQLDSTRPLFASYLRIRSLSSSTATATTTTTTPSPELTSARTELGTALSSLAEDLADLAAAVQAAETDPAHYGLAASELRRRQRLVQDVGAEIDDMRQELSSSSTRSVVGPSVSAAAAARAAANADLPDPNSFSVPDGDGGDGYDEFEQQQQVQIMREQDQMVDGVFVTVGNLRRQADDMGRELEEQSEMLQVVDTLADRVGGRLQTGIAKMGTIVRQNEDRWSGFCVGALILVLIILLILLLII